MGAGASGLAAAQELTSAGVSVVMVEARERIGGRILTLRVPRSAVPIELGAEFIHGNSAETFALLEQAGNTAVGEAGSFWRCIDGSLQPAQEPFTSVTAMFQRVNPTEADQSIDEFLARFAKDSDTQLAVAQAKLYAEGFDAVRTRDASVQAIAEELAGSAGFDSPAYRPSAGYDAVLETLTRSLPQAQFQLHLQSVVQTIRWAAGTVRVSGTRFGEPFQDDADAVIVTVPSEVLRTQSIRFSPRLAPETLHALDAIATGPVLKVVMQFAEPFWISRDPRLADAAFFSNDSTRFPTFWTMYPRMAPLIVAWAAGSRVDRFSDTAESALIDCALKDFAQTLGMHADELRGSLVSAHMHDWQSDPFSLGAYTYVRVGGSRAREALAKPLEQTIYIAGEATATQGRGGTVAGALSSGYAAARLLLDGRR